MAKGLDIGTSFLVCASKDPKNPQSEIQINSVRDAFLDIEAEQSVLNMLKMSNTSFIQEKEYIYIIGETALSVANMFKREARRPLSRGIISAGELDAEKVLIILLKSILKEPSVEKEVCYYSVPAKPIDRDVDIIYHEAIFKKIIESLGYKAVSMNESAAIVYANCELEEFTALASSWGAGMINTSLLF
jgi:actin-like ATPase involved in cell morphogenesis